MPHSFRPMAVAWLLLAVAATPSAAQHPVCASPAAGEVLLTSCRSWAAQPIVRLLDDFTVDHLFKPALPSFERTWLQLLAPFTTSRFEEKDAVRTLAKGLEPLRFTQLDRTTGTLSCDLTAAPRQIDLDSRGFGDTVSVHVSLPEILDGGYWRGPDVLQMAFWNLHRPTFQVRRDGTMVTEGSIQCVSLSSDGLLIRFAEEKSVPVFVQIRDCAS